MLAIVACDPRWSDEVGHGPRWGVGPSDDPLEIAPLTGPKCGGDHKMGSRSAPQGDQVGSPVVDPPVAGVSRPCAPRTRNFLRFAHFFLARFEDPHVRIIRKPYSLEDGVLRPHLGPTPRVAFLPWGIPDSDPRSASM